ncbi:hypothetical protein EAI_02382 [Harpegnathos saltator]|uniref:Uncharacterized protein n=1 Tax=Harpegnathos saltator TaxID=610380 RepID=E2BNS0_HARSA|nr:hypothetical protein EAI_02382 [Harpegnathos saltator]
MFLIQSTKRQSKHIDQIVHNRLMLISRDSRFPAVIANLTDLHLLPAMHSSSGLDVHLRLGDYHGEESRLSARMHLPFPEAGENAREVCTSVNGWIKQQIAENKFCAVSAVNFAGSLPAEIQQQLAQHDDRLTMGTE